MFYPEDFVEKVKTAFPDDTSLQIALDEGSPTAIQHLFRICPYDAVPASAVLEANTLEDLAELKKLAQKIQKVYSLKNEWYRLREQDHE